MQSLIKSFEKLSDANLVLEIDNLSVALPEGADRPYAIENLSLKVYLNEILCVVGESGSGKSVMAYTIMGLLGKNGPRPIGGRVLLTGEDLLETPPSRLRELRGTRMSMIFQEPMTALNPVMKIGDQIEEMLKIHTDISAKERAQRVIEVMKHVHLPQPEYLRNVYPHQLSGGQQQRVMIAMALVLRPKLLIADEPTTALDVSTQAQILKLIKEIQTTHNTGVIFITHDFGIVAEIADRVVVMQNGKLIEFGYAEQVLNNPHESYTKMLISAVPSLRPKKRPLGIEIQPVLSVEHLYKQYSDTGLFKKGRQVNAAEDVSFTIRRKETLGIVGESGSGKSTVARCVSRLIEPTSGQILIGDREISRVSYRKLRTERRRFQIIFQDPYRSLNPRRTIGQSIVEGLTNFNMPRREARERAREVLRLVGLDPKAIDRYPHQFSGGQRQRICIARALAVNPELLIADEPVSALDVSIQAQVLELLDDIRKKFNLSMLFITHDLRVAAQVCDNVAVMLNGKIIEYGPASEIFRYPKNEYTQTLFEAAPGKNWHPGGKGEG
jgi:peptide/nickel transport system ATP-binding protein